MSTNSIRPTVCNDAASLCSAALEVVVSLIQNEEKRNASEGRSSRVSLALSGGSTPKALYAALRAQHLDLAARSVQYFFGDVRMVADDSPHSNFLMAHEQLLHAVPADHVVPITTVGCTAAESAEQFECVLREQLPLVDDGHGDAGCPQLDIVLLGVGPDGHTASLFPGTPASTETEKCAVPCMPNEGVQPYVERVTITQRVIHAAKNVVLIAGGKDKQWVLEGILATDADVSDGRVAAPVARLVRKCRGNVVVLVNQDMIREHASL